MNSKLHLVSRAVVVVLLLCQSLRGVEYDEPLMFGIDVTNAYGGVRVDRIHRGRPIANKLKIRDVLISYALLDGSGRTRQMDRHETLDELKRELNSGKRAEVTFLRPIGNDNPPSRFNQLTVVLDASDLLPQTTVQVPTNTYQITRNIPYTDVPVAAVTDNDGIVTVAVYYATDRRLENGQYSGARDAGAEPVKYGVCEVTLPPDHRIGELEEPKWWKFQFRENPHKHVILSNVHQTGQQALLASVSEQFQQHPMDRRRLLVFVHGYNVSFEDAARRTAQLHYDLNFPGLSTFFSWPSNGDAGSYVSDGGDITWSTPHIREFLSLLNSRSDIDEIFLLAHSMGNRGATDALLELAARRDGQKIREVILAAPDIDAQLFDRDIAPRMCLFFPRTTLYASATDKALWASEALSEVYRAGEIRNGHPTVLSREKLDIIDASTVDTGFWDHSYFGDDETVIADIFHIIRNQLAPLQRYPFLEKTGPKGVFWAFR